MNIVHNSFGYRIHNYYTTFGLKKLVLSCNNVHFCDVSIFDGKK